MMTPKPDIGTDLSAALARLTVSVLWIRLSLPGKPGRSCRSPFREDKTPSFSISADGKSWKDFGTGESGGLIDFVQRARNCDKASAAQWLIEQAGTATPRPERFPEWSALSTGTIRDMADLSGSRGLPIFAGVQILITRGLLRFGDYQGRRCWFLGDRISHRYNIQARRIDRGLLSVRGRTDGIKAKTAPGSVAQMPIGVSTLDDRQTVLLCEGGPDLLAAATLSWWERAGRLDDVAFVAMLGAGQVICPTARDDFADKRVRIAAHADTAGRRAAAVWTRDLRRVGCTVDVLDIGAIRQGWDLADYAAAEFRLPEEHESEDEAGIGYNILP